MRKGDGSRGEGVDDVIVILHFCEWCKGKVNATWHVAYGIHATYQRPSQQTAKMTKSTDQSPMTPELRGLPVEILTYILDWYVYQFDKSNGDSPKWWLATRPSCGLLGMRLVCKTWSEAIIKMYFHRMCVHKSKRAKCILDNWNHTMYGSILLCPVRDLTIARLRYEHMGIEGRGEIQESPRPPVTMYEAVRLIERLGINVESLTFEFKYSMGFSPAMIKAVRPLKNLKELDIRYFIGSRDWPGICDPESFGNLITAIPRLESLSLQEGWHLDGIRLQPNTLSNLKEFSFNLCPENIKGLAHICQTAKPSLKVIDIRFASEMEHANVAFDPMKAILDHHFIIIRGAGDPIPTSVLNMEFPKLRVMGIHHREGYTSQTGWLHSPMLQNVRTMVVFHSYCYGGLRALKFAEVEALRNVPNFRHIIFVGWSDAKVDPDLIQAFKLRGIKCHFVSCLSHVKILELESEFDDTLEAPKTKIDYLPGGRHWTYN
ncbi:uncharacterized protein MELLADRAFT_101748 [Melampsora larici-populina 98AG31]|uniref:F-box domain-containing protein n=1 Tax=Melampsora larici-populina (strain 98AG31 / pathotype 3-4-7) TaxID=747676 RepID=F4R6U3_MELLP|nr:uncharacterized protein MELLADRAFT_101748 [Melampsora larici-populina 98AG31]EGG12395.1 hypothetical protein MELLADRAFT_101748 [Melampsora larici-populina 98AG31]